MDSAAGLICIMGSGETAPTMVSVHQELMERAGSPPGPAVILDTPYGFEENADDISAKALNYFAVNVGRAAEVASVRDFEVATAEEVERMLAAVRSARYIFAGPGSPSYALRQWAPTSLSGLLRARLADGACVTFASAAATTLGRVALPVYEIYKVGQPPHWLDGIDVMAAAGLNVGVIPHFDNRQGGTHDTRYCFMGARRLRVLEEMLPAGTSLLGVAEHTAAVIDLRAGTIAVKGRGFAAWRSGGKEERFGAGEVVPLSQLRTGPALPSQEPGAAATAPSPGDAGARFDRALGERDASAALAALLDEEARLAGEDGGEAAHSEFRGMLVRFADVAREGLEPRRARVAPFVEMALRLRDAARAGRRFDDADGIRDELVRLGVEVRDTPEGTEWEIRGDES